MSRTITKNEPCLPLGLGKDSMTFYKPEDSPKPMYPFRAYIAPGSVFTGPSHFHLIHDEVFIIEQGQMDIIQNGVRKTYDASSGEITVTRGTIYSLHAVAPADAPVIMWERTEPGDSEKELMFRVMQSVFLDSSTYHKTGKPAFSDVLQLNLTIYECDGYMALLPRLGRGINLFIDGALAWVARRAGYKIAYPEYVTDELWESVVGAGKSL